jgi:ribonuclease PH
MSKRLGLAYASGYDCAECHWLCQCVSRTGTSIARGTKHVTNPNLVTRHDKRQHDELRPLKIKRHFTRAVPGSVLIQAGRTTVLCTASVAEQVPPWMAGKGRGWVTAEYGMLPGSTRPRKDRDRGGKIDGRTTEIQRLVGRSLRAVVDLDALGERTVTLDCDVLEADGGTRTLSITGAWIALVDALHECSGGLSQFLRPGTDAQRWSIAKMGLSPSASKRATLPLTDSVAAVSVGIVEGRPILDLDYQEDSAAAVDMNVVMTGGRRFVEVQGTGEEATFTEAELSAMLQLARQGIDHLTAAQRSALGKAWPL